MVAVKHDQRWEILQYWLGVLFQDVQGEVHYAKFLRQKVALQWLKQSSYPLMYTPGDACNGNSLKCILTRVVEYTREGTKITLPSEEDNRLSRLANGDLRDVEDVIDIATETIEDEREVSFPRLPGVSLSGRQTTRFY